MKKCFADKGDYCAALVEKNCFMCPFGKTEKRVKGERAAARRRLKEKCLLAHYDEEYPCVYDKFEVEIAKPAQESPKNP